MLGVSSIKGMVAGEGSNSIIFDFGSHATGMYSSGGVGGNSAGHSVWYAGGEFHEGEVVNGLDPRDRELEGRGRESADRGRESNRVNPCEERCSHDGKFTATLLLDKKREIGDGRGRREPCEARRRSLEGLWVSCASELEFTWESIFTGRCMVRSSEGEVGQFPWRFIQSIQSVGGQVDTAVGIEAEVEEAQVSIEGDEEKRTEKRVVKKKEKMEMERKSGGIGYRD